MSLFSYFPDPVSLKALVPDPENKAFPKDITEFSFSPDYDYLAVGLNDGYASPLLSSTFTT